MSRKSLTIWLLCLLFFTSSSAFALSLGKIKVISTFAQPFLAEISLPAYTEEEMGSIEIHLASKRQFEERGIEMLPVLKKFKFSVEEKKGGRLYIKVHTKNAVKELSLSFLMEVTWAGGRLIKSYDVLLTPEAITEFWEQRAREIIAQVEVEAAKEAPVEIAPPVKQTRPKETKPAIRQTMRAANSNATPVQPKPNNKLRKTASGGLEYSPVGNGESLSAIAQKIRPDYDMTINQVMVALFEQNQEAFSKGNINRLLAGVTLTIEDTQTITQISKREAMQLAQQYMHGSKMNEEPTMIAKNTTEQATSAKPEVVQSLNNRLEISSANDEAIPQEILQRIKDEQIATAEEELKISQLDMEMLRTENETLKERIADLEEQLDATAESLFLATIQQETVKDAPNADSLTQQDQNLIVANTNMGMEGNEKLSLMQRIEKYQTAISISSATLLSMTLLGIRKKDKLLDILHSVKERFNKPKQADDSQFG